MTTKRFTVEKLDLVSDHLSTRFFIVDNENMSSYDVQHIVSEGFEVQFGSWAEKIADELNELHEENQHLQSHLNMVREQRDKQTDKSKTLQKQLDTEHQMLENAILLERTRMGQNSLKQYRDAIL